MGAILSLISLGQPLMIKTGVVLSTTGLILSVPEKVNAESSDFYFDRAYEKGELGDHYGAISDYTKAIEINPKLAEAYYNRAIAKDDLKDYYGAIADYTKAIEINPRYASSYYNRGQIRQDNLGDNYGAISDYNKAIEIRPKHANSFRNRGIAKELIGDMKGACADWREASYLGEQDAAQWVRNQCQ